MKFLSVAAVWSQLLAFTLATAPRGPSPPLPGPQDLPRSIPEFRQKHPYRSPPGPRPGGGPPGEPGVGGGTPDQRHVVTIRPSDHDADDVSAEFKAGLERANHGGTLYLPAGQTYVIGRPLDLTFLDDVHVHLDGEVLFTNDTSYWQSVAFTHPFQNTIMFWKWGGNNTKIYGEGVLNGNGQRWWNEFAGKQILDEDNTYLRPVLFYAENTTGWSVEGITFKDSPCWHNFVVTSSDFTYKDIVVTAVSNNASAKPANSDFFDSLNLDGLTVERAWVNNGDDCFSPKANTSNIYVNHMYCNGSHGQSMGSIGQYAGELDYIEHVLIENVWIVNSQFGGRLKTWAGSDVGYGYINNVTFRNFYNADNEYSAYLDSCYFNINATECAASPSQVNITNITFENFSGYTSGKYGRAVARLTCSTNPDAVCDNIVFKNFTVTSPCGTSNDNNAVVICDGISDLGWPCVNSTSAEAVAALADTCTVELAA